MFRKKKKIKHNILVEKLNIKFLIWKTYGCQKKNYLKRIQNMREEIYLIFEIYKVWKPYFWI